MAFDAATALAADVYFILNPLAHAAGLPEIDVRIGADFNRAKVQTVGSASNRVQIDVLGLAVSMAAKVQGRGAPREVWVGQTLYENLHVSRQDLLERATPDGTWNFVGRDGEPYELHSFHLPSG